MLDFYCAVARQCFINEYVFSMTEAEAEQAQRLRASLEQALAAGGPCPALWPVVVGAYFPLHTLANAQALLDRSWPQCVERFDRPAGQGTGGGTPDRRDDSRSDRHRRRGIARGAPAIRGKSLSALGRRRRRRRQAASPATSASRGRLLDVLIAGCGTGLSTIEFARQARGARDSRHRSEPRQPQLRQAHGAKARPRQYRIRPGRHHEAGLDRAAVRFHRRVRRPAPSRRSLGRLAGVAVAAAPGRQHAGRSLQRTGAPEHRRGARADRRARLSADRGGHPALPRGHHAPPTDRC